MPTDCRVPAVALLGVLGPTTTFAADAGGGAGPLGTMVCLMITMALVIGTVLVHYGGLNLIIGVCDRIPGQRRLRIAEMVTGILMLHLVEIGLFAAGFRLLAWDDPAGGLSGQQALNWGDYFYFAATVYTTVGFGDLVPQAGLRLLSAFTSLTGLVMITWSASLTFVEMQRARHRDARDSAEGRPRPSLFGHLSG